MPQFFDEGGKPIPDADVPAAIAAGKAFAQQQRVQVRAPDGSIGTMDVGELAGSGYQPLTDSEIHAEQLHRERGTLGQQAITAGEGALRGATVGLSDAALGTVLGKEYTQGAEERKEENPWTAAGSSLVGAVAPALLSGGAAEAATAGKLGVEAAGATEGLTAGKAALGAAEAISAPARAVAGAGSLVERGMAAGLRELGFTGESLASRAAGKALTLGASGVAEGALFGAGDAASESYLKGEPLTSEALVGSIGRNALFGGALGAGLGVLGEAIPAAASKLLPSKEKLEKFAEERAGKQLGQDWEKIGAKKGADAAAAQKSVVAKDLLNYEMKTGPNAGKTILQVSSKPEDISHGISAARQEIGAAREGVIRSIDEGIAARPDVAAVAAPDIGEYLARVKSEVTDPLRASTSPAMRRMAKGVDRELSILTERARPPATPVVPGELGGAVANDVTQAPMTFGELLQARQDLRKSFQPAAPAGGGLPPPPPKNAEYLEKAERILANYLDEKASHALAALGEDSARYTELTRQYASFATMDKIAQKQVSRFAKNRTVSLTDHMMGLTAFMGAIGSGNMGALAAMGMGAASSVVNKLAREQGNAVLADIAHRVAQRDSMIVKAAHALAMSKPAEVAGSAAKSAAQSLAVPDAPRARAFAPLGAVELKSNYEELSSRVRELQEPAHQQAQITHATSSVSGDYPEAAAGMSQQLLRTHAYLASQLPPVPPPNRMSPNASPPLVDRRTMAKYLSKADGALHPAQVMADISKGIIDDDAIGAMRELYPQTFGQLRQQTMALVASKKEALPYSRVIHLSKVFGFDGDSSLSPSRFPEIQKVIQQISAQPQPNGASPGTPGKTTKARPSSSRAASVGKSFALPGSKTPGSI